MNNVNLEYYRIFYHVAKYENFTKAARILGSNQPNVTRAMNRLEEEIGCVLFIRTNRGIRLTPEGEHLYAYVKGAMAQIHQAEEELSALNSLTSGSVSIGASETALNSYLLDILKDFHLEYPHIRIRISNNTTRTALAAVKNGEVDFAVVTTPAEAEAPLRSIPLLSFRELLVGGRTFTALSGQALPLSELKHYSLIGLERDTVTYSFYENLFFRYHLEIEPDIQVATTDQLIALVRSELGLAFIPEPVVRELIARSEIVKIPTLEEIPSRSVCLVYDPQRPTGNAAKMLRGKLVPASSAAL